MGMDVEGINPTTISEEPKRPDNLYDLSDEEVSSYWEARNKWLDENPGVYFRANVWSWRPICEAMWESGACYELPDGQWEHMSFNDGAGARSREECDRMAAKLRSWMNEKIWDDTNRWVPEGYDKDDMQVDEQGRFVSKTEAELKDVVTHSPYSVSKEHLEAWIRFLENCGDGFEVW